MTDQQRSTAQISEEALEPWLREHAPMFYLVLDGDGDVLDSNPFTRALVGEGRLAGGAKEIFLAFDTPLDLAELRRTPEIRRLLSISTTAGQPESLHLTFMPQGSGTRVLGGVDILETLHLRQELLSLNNQLNGLTREVQRQNRELRRLNALKTRFLGMAAHDLRKPVSAVLSFSEFLLDEAKESLGEEHYGFLEIIRRSTGSMKDLIDSFLDASLIDAGRFALNLELDDIGPAIRQSVALHQPLASRTRVTLELQMAESLPLISADSAKLEQVLNNLIANAIEHSDAGARVHVSVDEELGGVRIAVQDEGAGIAPALQAGVFELFNRGSAGKGNARRGVGLGLAISKKIVASHEGRLELQSELGRGSTFTVHLPANQSGAAVNEGEVT